MSSHYHWEQERAIHSVKRKQGIRMGHSAEQILIGQIVKHRFLIRQRERGEESGDQKEER
jgi:hypothetical protein